LLLLPLSLLLSLPSVAAVVAVTVWDRKGNALRAFTRIYANDESLFCFSTHTHTHTHTQSPPPHTHTHPYPPSSPHPLLTHTHYAMTLCFVCSFTLTYFAVFCVYHTLI
jgi:hypothetical protein